MTKGTWAPGMWTVIGLIVNELARLVGQYVARQQDKAAHNGDGTSAYKPPQS